MISFPVTLNVFLIMLSEFEHREHAEAHSLKTFVCFLQTLSEALCCDSGELCSLHGKNQDHEYDCSFSCSHITQLLPSLPACQSVPCTSSPAVPGLSPSLLASESIAETLSCYTKSTNQLGLYIKLPNYWIHPQKQY